jgi:xanthine dehydrogenase YagT iron-sulfur-binding subunit
MIDSGPSLRAAARLSIPALATYLKSAGWTVRPSRVKGVSVFSKTLRGAVEPVHILLPDLPGIEEEEGHRRIADALRTIEAVEERPIFTIVDQISRDSSGHKVSGHFNSGEVVPELMLTPLKANRKFEAPGGGIARSGARDDAAHTVSVRLTVNGTSYTLLLDPRSSLLDVLRELLALTGAKKGCDHGQCGACTVHLDGRSVLSCLTPAVQLNGRQVVTIEGLSPPGGHLHPMQQAFIDHDALQCGYCTPGQIMAAVACVSEGYATSPDQIREYMSGNICRCGAYVGIVAAIWDAAPKMRRA